MIFYVFLGMVAIIAVSSGYLIGKKLKERKT